MPQNNPLLKVAMLTIDHKNILKTQLFLRMIIIVTTLKFKFKQCNKLLEYFIHVFSHNPTCQHVKKIQNNPENKRTRYKIIAHRHFQKVILKTYHNAIDNTAETMATPQRENHVNLNSVRISPRRHLKSWTNGKRLTRAFWELQFTHSRQEV